MTTSPFRVSMPPSMGGGPVLDCGSAALHRATRAPAALGTAWTRSWSLAAWASPVATSVCHLGRPLFGNGHVAALVIRGDGWAYPGGHGCPKSGVGKTHVAEGTRRLRLLSSLT